MRLLNTSTFQLESFTGDEDDIPPYAILSHTWRASEILFTDFSPSEGATHAQVLNRLRDRPEFRKIEQSVVQAVQDNLTYIWIDTCCIDKSSSAELSEAINSMFRWYQRSAVCYVHLSDFEVICDSDTVPPSHGSVKLLSSQNRAFASSRWFERGWTLQELIAPRNVRFFDTRWVEFGARDGDLFGRVCERTGILPEIFISRRCMCSGNLFASLRGGKCVLCNTKDNLTDILGSLHASLIMSWASTRVTTRKEDSAYCLIGLFDINMPLLYGEGSKAFRRLQSAIVAHANDDSILLWRAKADPSKGLLLPGCLAASPKAFLSIPPIVPQREYYDFENEMIPRLAAGMSQDAEPIEISENLMRITLWLSPCRVGYPYDRMSRSATGMVGKDWVLGILNCHSASDYLVRPAILLLHMGGDLYRRIAKDCIFFINPRKDPPTSVVTLSMYHENPNTGEEASKWTPIEDLSLDKAVSKRIKLLIRSSGPSLLPTATGSYDRICASTDAVCSVVNRMPWSQDDISVKILGGYPAIYAANSRPLNVPLLRSLLKYECKRGLGLIGGIHLIEVSSCQEQLEERLYILWGLHHDVSTGHRNAQLDLAGRPWCRIFRTAHFADSDIPTLENKGSDESENKDIDSRYRKKLKSWLDRKSHEYHWLLTLQDGSHREILPDAGSIQRSPADRCLDLFPNSKLRLGLTARMHVSRNLGVATNDVELTLVTPECRGWQTNSFDGSPTDQQPTRDPAPSVRRLFM